MTSGVALLAGFLLYFSFTTFTTFGIKMYNILSYTRLKMLDINWYSIQDLYTIEKYKIKHKKDPVTKWIKLPCVYKIKINNKIVHIGRSDTCKKHGGAEKVRKALVNLLNVLEYNPSVTKTKYWEKIRLQHRPNSSNIKIGIIKTNAIKKTYIQETQRSN